MQWLRVAREQCSRGDKCSFQYDIKKRAKSTPKTTLNHRHKEVEVHRGKGASGDKCSFAHRHVEGHPSKKKQRKMDGDKSAVAVLKDARQLGCVLQDVEPPESLPSLLTSTKSLGINSTSTIHKSCAASSKHPRKQRSVARKKSCQNSSSAQSLSCEI